MAVTIAQTSASPLLTAQDSAKLQQVWTTIGPDSCPYTYNFHMHTRCSDGQLTPEALIEQAIAIGLQGLAITDHHTIWGYSAAQALLDHYHQEDPQKPLPHLWTGVEINAKLNGTGVHILGYAFDPDHPAIGRYLQRQHAAGHDLKAINVINAIHQAGGLAVLAHPARYGRPARQLIPTAAHLGIDGVEAYYAYRNPNPWKTSPKQTKEVKALAEQYQLYQTCGTDTHGRSLLQRV